MEYLREKKPHRFTD